MEKLVEDWFKSKIATGEIASDTVAYNFAQAAKGNLIEQLKLTADEPPPMTPMLVVGHWYQRQFIIGPLARNAAAAKQAEDAKADLLSAVAKSPVAKPISQPVVEKE